MSENLITEEGVCAQECRACLTKLKHTETSYDLFFCWESLWDRSETTIAEDMAKLAHIKISKEDQLTHVICESCHTKLLQACQFVSCIRNSDNILKKRYQSWPEPIKLDDIKHVDSSVGIPEIKQEVMSDEELIQECEGIEEFDVTDIKIEPEEFVQPSISSDNGIIVPENPDSGLSNGTAESDQAMETTKSRDKTREDILEAKRRASQLRHENIKKNPKLSALRKKQQKENYAKRKREKRVVSIKDKSTDEQQKQRQKWRENSRAYYSKRKKTDPPSEY